MSALRSATKEKEYVAKMQKQQKELLATEVGTGTRGGDVLPSSQTSCASSRSESGESRGSRAGSRDYSWESYYYSSEHSSSELADDDFESWEPKDDLEEILLNSLQNFKLTSDRMYNRSSDFGRGQEKSCTKFHSEGEDTCPRCEQDVLPHQVGDFEEELSVLRQALSASY